MDGSSRDTRRAAAAPPIRLGYSHLVAHSDSLDPALRLEAVGAYRLQAILDVDRLGQVYLGTHAEGGNSCCVRVLARHVVDTPALLERSIHEARFANDLRHPNVVDLVEVVDEGEPRQVALVTPFVEGPSFHQIAREGVTPETALALVCQLVHGLRACHQSGVVHGNLTPSNVFAAEPIDPDASTAPRTLITGFGFSHIAGRIAPDSTRPHGDLAYLAPEQFGRPNASTAADVYAVGEILYEILTGRQLYAETSDRGRAVAVGLPAVPYAQTLTDLINRCVSTDPEQRPTLDDVRLALSPLVPEQDCTSFEEEDEFGEASFSGVHHEPSGQWSVIKIISRPAGAAIRRVGVSGVIATAPYDLVVSADLPFVELELQLDGHASRRIRVRTDEKSRIVDMPFVISER